MKANADTKEALFEDWMHDASEDRKEAALRHFFSSNGGEMPGYRGEGEDWSDSLVLPEYANQMP